jgi:hypothetical protein
MVHAGLTRDRGRESNEGCERDEGLYKLLSVFLGYVLGNLQA